MFLMFCQVRLVLTSDPFSRAMLMGREGIAIRANNHHFGGLRFGVAEFAG